MIFELEMYDPLGAVVLFSSLDALDQASQLVVLVAQLVGSFVQALLPAVAALLAAAALRA